MPLFTDDTWTVWGLTTLSTVLSTNSGTDEGLQSYRPFNSILDKWGSDLNDDDGEVSRIRKRFYLDQTVAPD